MLCLPARRALEQPHVEDMSAVTWWTRAPLERSSDFGELAGVVPERRLEQSA